MRRNLSAEEMEARRYLLDHAAETQRLLMRETSLLRDGVTIARPPRRRLAAVAALIGCAVFGLGATAIWRASGTATVTSLAPAAPVAREPRNWRFEHEHLEDYTRLVATVEDVSRQYRQGPVDAECLERARKELARWPLDEIAADPQAGMSLVRALIHLSTPLESEEITDFLTRVAATHENRHSRRVAVHALKKRGLPVPEGPPTPPEPDGDAIIH